MIRNERAKKTRESILNNAEIVLYETPPGRVTLEDIASASGVTRGAVYGHFSNKCDLIRAIFERASTPLVPFTIPERHRQRDLLSTLQRDLQRCVADAFSHGPKRRLYAIATSIWFTDPDCHVTKESVRSAMELATSRISNVLQQAHAAGETRTLPDPDLAATHVYAGLAGCFYQSLLSQELMRDAANRMVRYCLSLIGPDTMQ